MKKILLFFIALLSLGGIFFYYFLTDPMDFDIRFPITYVPYSKQPRTLVKIDGKVYPLGIDFGSSCCITLEKEVLENIQNKYFLEERIGIDGIGQEHPVKAYRLPSAKIWHLLIKKAQIEESFPALQIYGEPPSRADILKHHPGHIGRGVFQITNWFMDFRNSVFIAGPRLCNRKNDGYNFDSCVQVPFTVDPVKGILLTIETDIGLQKFMLDTGATNNFIKPSVLKKNFSEPWFFGMQKYDSSKFIISGKDFGQTRFILFELSNHHFDGILGVDFFREYIVYLDFKKNIALIGKSEECVDEECKARLNRFEFPPEIYLDAGVD